MELYFLQPFLMPVKRDHNCYGKINTVLRQINVFTKELNKELISRKIFDHDRVFVHFHTAQCGKKREIPSH